MRPLRAASIDILQGAGVLSTRRRGRTSRVSALNSRAIRPDVRWCCGLFATDCAGRVQTAFQAIHISPQRVNTGCVAPAFAATMRDRDVIGDDPVDSHAPAVWRRVRVLAGSPLDGALFARR